MSSSSAMYYREQSKDITKMIGLPTIIAAIILAVMYLKSYGKCKDNDEYKNDSFTNLLHKLSWGVIILVAMLLFFKFLPMIMGRRGPVEQVGQAAHAFGRTMNNAFGSILN